MNNLEGKVAIVTGGSEGIGYGISEALAKRGALVYLVARTKEKLESAKAKIESQGGKAEIRTGDVTQLETINSIIEEVYLKNKRLDIFVNNAGGWKYHSIESDFSDIWKFIEYIMKSTYGITHSLVNRFQNEKNNDLKILNILSQAALQYMPGNLGYGPAKKGLAAALFDLEGEMETKKINNIKLYRLYPNTVATEAVLPAVKEGKISNPTTVQSVVDTAIDMLYDKTPTRDVRIGYYPEKGIVRKFYGFSSEAFSLLPYEGEEVIDEDFDPKRNL